MMNLFFSLLPTIWQAYAVILRSVTIAIVAAMTAKELAPTTGG